MKIKEIVEGYTHSDFDWHKEVTSRPEQWGLVDNRGKIIRPGLTKSAAEALLGRPDLVKKYGRLFAKQLS